MSVVLAVPGLVVMYIHQQLYLTNLCNIHGAVTYAPNVDWPYSAHGPPEKLTAYYGTCRAVNCCI